MFLRYKTQRISRLWSTVIVVALLIPMFPLPANANPSSRVGIWYNTWYTNEGKYNWLEGYGAGSQKQFLGDVNGDGKEDAVAYFDTGGLNGDWYVGLSDGTKFNGAAQPWLTGFGDASHDQFIADVNGDGKADVVLYYDVPGALGKWYVALSNGSSFVPHSAWLDGHGSGSQRQMVEDIDGDGKADAVAFFDVPGFAGKWYTALSNGSSFGGGGGLWRDGYAAGSQKQFLGDVNGDAKADAVAYWNAGAGWQGIWYAALSGGGSFGAPTQWTNGHGAGSNHQLLGDRNGDGKYDAIAYWGAGGGAVDPGTWRAANSNATGTEFEGDQLWKYTHGQYGDFVNPADNALMGDVDGNGTDDPVAFDGDLGEWRYLPADQYIEPAAMNLWEGWGVKYRPLVNGVPTAYDSGDPEVIDEHLQMIEDAGIDYLLFEMTNGIEQSFTFPRAKIACERIAAHNANGGNLKFAVAVGSIQWSHDPQTVENEAETVMDEFASEDTICGPHYFQWQSKPLLAAYGNYDDITGWEAYPNKTHTNDFTVIPALSKLPSGGGTSYPASTGSGCGTVPSSLLNTPNPSRYGDFMAWGLPYGTLGSGPVMNVMPGWKNGAGDRILRQQYGIHGGFFNGCGWDRVLASSASAQMVVINSFNEFAERTGVQPAQTSEVRTNGLIDIYEQWPNPYFYWNIVQAKVAQLKQQP